MGYKVRDCSRQSRIKLPKGQTTRAGGHIEVEWEGKDGKTLQRCPDPEVISKIWDLKIEIKHAFLIFGETVVKKRTLDFKQDLNQQPAKGAAAQQESHKS